MKAAMKFYVCVYLVLLIFLICFSEIGFCQTTRLPQSEVEGLKQVAKALGVTGWDFTMDPCDLNFSRKIQDSTQGFQRYVKCNCSSTDCHVTNLSLKGMNLSGTLPPELELFPHLVEIDLTRNFLNGTIPPQWASLPLLKISLLGNRLTGQIPKEFGRMTTLNELTLEANWLSGPIPPELGNLTNLTKAQIGSNGFNGTLPDTLANLKNLVDFRISQTNLSGKMPDLIGNWTNLQKLHIQGTNMVGPIPSTISRLTNLTDLRISDMNGSTNAVPDLSTMVNMSFLILRNCNISGKLPDYLSRMLNLTVLDFSFNKFAGEIPQSFQSLNNINYMYLTRNFLTGTVPGWMLLRKKDIDLSYNNLTWVDTLSSSSCQQGTVNLLGNSYTESDLGKATPCFTNSACPNHQNYYLYINCGGDKVSVGDYTYLDDRDLGSSSRYYVSSENNWAFSSTGNFLDNEMVPDSYIESNTSILSMPDAKLYMQARISPISLTYYGLCLGNGNYTVRLHFAEIRITDGESFTSLGRRIFDVYIQGKLVMKDFNIKDEARGSNKAIVKNYSSVPVVNNTLEIRLYWAGKGTTSLPHKVFYGPLISAISVEPEFKPPGGKKTVKIVVGILSSMLFLIIMILGILWWKGFLGRKYQDLRDLDLQTASFTLRQMKAATKNFNAANKIGEGGFGPVYKGLLPDGTVIAVKMLSSKSRQGNREFLNEIGMISALQHPNLVKLLGCCVEGIQLLLVYEFMENNSLARALFGPTEYQLNLDWPTRKKICLGIARGLAYLHGESRLKIVHRDIKPTNVLLDKDLNPKISDFGLARLNDDENTHISTRIAGTVGYMAPEYATRGYLTDKADVYSFGVVLLEVVSGKSNSNWRPTEDCFFLLDWAHVSLKRGQLKELIDPRLGMEFNEKEAIRMIKIVFLCTSASPVDRPSMSVVLSMLEGKTQVPDTTNLNLSTHYSNYSIPDLSEKSFSHSAKSLPVDFPHTYPSVTESDVSLQSNVSML